MTDDLDLLPLGCIAPAGDLAAAIEQASSDPVRAVDFARRHRVIGLVSLRLAQAPTEIDDVVAAARMERAALSDRLDRTWHSLRQEFGDVSWAIRGIKGYAARALYADPLERDVGDVDILVNHVDQAWVMAERLRQEGYDFNHFELPWIKRDSLSGELYGQILMWKQVEGTLVKIDIHFNGYSLRHCRHLNIAPNGRGVAAMDPVANLPMLLANAAGDHQIRMKDLNDVVLLLECGQDLGPALATVRRHKLGGTWNALLDLTAVAADLTNHAQDRRERYRVPGARALVTPFGATDRRQRFRVTVSDSVRAGYESGGMHAAVRNGFTAARYYRRPLKITVAAQCDHRARDRRVLEAMRMDTCVRLVPTRWLESLQEDPASWLVKWPKCEGPAPTPSTSLAAIPGTTSMVQTSDSRHTYVVAASEIFAPTIYCRMCSIQAAYPG